MSRRTRRQLKWMRRHRKRYNARQWENREHHSRWGQPFFPPRKPDGSV